MTSVEELSFVTYLKREIQHANKYVSKIRDCGQDLAFFSLNLETESRASLQLLYGGGIDEECSLWEVQISDETMRKHMEEDVEISTSLQVFASYFCDALLTGPQIPLLPQHFPVLDSATTLALKLLYTVGNMQLEGLLRLSLVQQHMPKAVFSMMATFSAGSLANQVTKESRSSRPKPELVTINRPVKALTEGDEEDGAAAGQEAVESGPVKAKKRKAGGVSLFAKKK